jgi:hypothetical protein
VSCPVDRKAAINNKCGLYETTCNTYTPPSTAAGIAWKGVVGCQSIGGFLVSAPSPRPSPLARISIRRPARPFPIRRNRVE